MEEGIKEIIKMARRTIKQITNYNNNASYHYEEEFVQLTFGEWQEIEKELMKEKGRL